MPVKDWAAAVQETGKSCAKRTHLLKSFAEGTAPS
jgi:hypothetical protein